MQIPVPYHVSYVISKDEMDSVDINGQSFGSNNLLLVQD